MTKQIRLALCAAVTLVSTSIVLASDPMTLSAPGAFLNDHDLSNPGSTVLTFPTPLTPVTIDSVESVSLLNLSHSAAGNLDAYLHFVPDNILESPITAYLFAGLNDGFFLTLSDFDGNYVFSNSSTTELQPTVFGLGTNDSIPSDTYIPSGFYIDPNPMAETDLTAALGGVDLSSGVLYLIIEDYQPGDSGLISEAQISLMVSGVPEPASLFTLGMSGLIALRRRAR